MRINNPGPNIGTAEVSSFEQEVGMTLSEDYRQFLKTFNGGSPDPDIIDIEGFDSSPTDIQVLFGLDRAEESSDLYWNLSLVRGKLGRRDLIPFACDSGGNLFCIKPKADVDMIIYIDNFSNPTEFTVARDFSSFMNKIRNF